MHTRRFILPCLAVAILLLPACAPAPIYKPAPDAINALPSAVARAPEQYGHASVIWGGRIIKVTNLADSTEIELLAYPLDGSQRPRLKDAAGGRFIAIVPGYLESLNYPPGRLMTVSGHLAGSRGGEVGSASYVFPLVDATQTHLWTPEELRSAWSNVRIGVGVGGTF